MKSRFEAPYAALLDAKVKFYAALGNHDNASGANYKNWNMNGQRFYTFRVADSGASNEVSGLDLYFQAVSRTGKTVDSGVIHHSPFAEVVMPAEPLPATSGSTPVVPAPVSAKPPVEPTPSPSPKATPEPAASPTPKPTPTPTPKPSP